MDVAMMSIGMFVGLCYTPSILAAVLGKHSVNTYQIILHAAGWTTVFIGSML